MKNKGLQLVTVLVLTILAACTSAKKVPYLKTDDESTQVIDLPTMYKDYAVRFKPNDILSITVNAGLEPAVAAAFNLPMQPSATLEGSITDVNATGVGKYTYLVNQDGEILFPILGKIKVANMTRNELETYLTRELRSYIEKEEPIVAVRLVNFRILLLGEVSKPGEITIVKDRVNILEALALAGDMSIYGRRDNVSIIRLNPDGTLRKIRVDLNSTDVVSSPYFYLQQEDIVYVEPNKTKARESGIGSDTGLLFSIISLVMSTTSFIFLILDR